MINLKKDKKGWWIVDVTDEISGSKQRGLAVTAEEVLELARQIVKNKSKLLKG